MSFRLLPVALSLLPLLAVAGDWPQWRGPHRNGVASEGPKLIEALPEGDLPVLWESEPIPSNDDGGLGSVVVADGRAYLSVVWHRDEPAETRRISELVLRQLGHQPLGALGPELVQKMEETRASLSPALRGKKLDEFAQKWIEANLDRKQQQLFAGYIEKRFKKGALAMPLDALDKLAGQQQRVFASDAEMRAWLDAQGFSDDVKAQVIAAVPPTRRVAEDTVICLDAATGRTLWKSRAPGEATGRNSSSTPSVANGRVFALGSVNACAVDAVTGRQLWSAPLPQKGAGSSPLAVADLVIVNARTLFALDASTGAERWKQPKAGGGNSSPVAWTAGGRTLILCNGRNTLDAVDAKTGEVVWSVPGAGDSTPAIAGDLLAMQARKPQQGLFVYRLKADGAELLWTVPLDALRTQASPIVHGDLVFLADNDAQYCFDATTGRPRWNASVPGSIASPILADGKFLCLINNGNNVAMLRADGAARTELGKAHVKAAWVPSPAIADGRLFLRLKDRVRCYALTR